VVHSSHYMHSNYTFLF